MSRHWRADRPARLTCWSQPRWKICTKRTPRSTSRRASRQLAAKVPGLCDVGAVHVEDLASGSFERSISSGTRGLHAERHLVLRDARLDFRIADLVEIASG